MDHKFTIDRDNKKVIMERLFDAPPELLYKAHTYPNLIPEWWKDTTVEEMDVKVGGKWKFGFKNEQGWTSSFFGEYKELVPNERIVETFNIGSAPGNTTTNTTTFEAVEGGKTKLTKVIEYATLEQLEQMVKYGMEEGEKEGNTRLSSLLEKMKRGDIK